MVVVAKQKQAPSHGVQTTRRQAPSGSRASGSGVRADRLKDHIYQGFSCAVHSISAAYVEVGELNCITGVFVHSCEADDLAVGLTNEGLKCQPRCKHRVLYVRRTSDHQI